MTHKRNTQGLLKAVETKRKAVWQRAQTALHTLEKEAPEQINFRRVAKAAQVSVAWLYQQPELRQRIERYRQQNDLSVNNASSERHHHKMEALTLRIKKLEAENKTLRHQLEILYGELTKP